MRDHVKEIRSAISTVPSRDRAPESSLLVVTQQSSVDGQRLAIGHTCGVMSRWLPRVRMLVVMTGPMSCDSSLEQIARFCTECARSPRTGTTVRGGQPKPQSDTVTMLDRTRLAGAIETKHLMASGDLDIVRNDEHCNSTRHEKHRGLMWLVTCCSPTD